MPEPNDFYEDDADFAYEDGEYDHEVNESDYMPAPVETDENPDEKEICHNCGFICCQCEANEKQFRQEEKDEWLKQEKEIPEELQLQTHEYLVTWTETVGKSQLVYASSKEEAKLRWEKHMSEFFIDEEGTESGDVDDDSVDVERWSE